MIQHLIKCEVCNNQFEFNPMERPYGRMAPEGWLTLFPMKDMQGSEGWHFCSLACIYRWIEKLQDEVQGEPVQESPYIRREEGV
jgi:hypothetical protein